MTRQRRNERSDAQDCCAPGESCEMDRRMFVKLGGATLAALGAAGAPLAAAGPFLPEDTVDHFVPADKKLRPDWVKSLFARGESTWYQGDDLKTIGMPTEMVVENREIVQTPAIDQGFSIKVVSDKGTQVRSLDRNGFPQVRFCGEYPIGLVDYVDDAFPVHVELEAFSPFIPLNAEDSALPATILNYKLKNTSSVPVQATLAGWLQNAALHYSQPRCEATYRRVNTLKKGAGVTSVLLGTRKVEGPAESTREPIVFADFEGGDYGDWKIEGEAFGQGPAKGTLEKQQLVSGYRGKGLVNSFLGGSDQLQGKLISPEFTIERPYISFLAGGGAAAETALRLIVDGKVVKTASGTQVERLLPHNWNVRELVGKQAHLEIVDEESRAWGHINIDQIEFRDTPMNDEIADVRKLSDFGTLALSVTGDAAPLVSTSLPESVGPMQIFAEDGLASDDAESRALSGNHRSAVGKEIKLEPGAEVTLSFVVSWHMPNLYHNDDLVRNRYASRFQNAAEVARSTDATVARHVLRFHIALLAARSAALDRWKPGNRDLPMVGKRKVLGLRRVWLLSWDVWPCVELRARDGSARSLTGTFCA